MRTVTILIAALVAAAPLKAQDGNPLAPPEALPEAPRYYGRVLALCVGIDDYAYPDRITNLDYSVADAKEMSRVLSERYGFETTELLGKEATRDAIKGEIGRLSSLVEEEDCLVVYLSGHGATVEVPAPPDDPIGFPRNVGYYLPYDCEGRLDPAGVDPDVYAKTALDMRRIAGDLVALRKRTKHVVLMLDSCFSGFAAVQSRGGSSVHLQLLRRPSKQVMTAGTADQKVYENDAMGHGVFTWAVLRELDPEAPARAGEILSLQELYVRTRNTVLAWSERTSNEMLPMHRHLQDDAGDFVFVPLAHEGDVDDALARKFGPSEGAAAKGGATPRDPNAPPAEPKSVPASTPGASPAPAPSAPPPVDRETPVSDAELNAIAALAARRTVEEATLRPLLDEASRRRFDRFRCRGAAGDSNAMASLFYCHDKAIGTRRDERAARRWGVETGQSDRNLGGVVLTEIFEKGIGGEPDGALARRFRAAVKIDALPPELRPFAEDAFGRVFDGLPGGRSSDGKLGKAGDVLGEIGKLGDVLGGRKSSGDADPPGPAPRPVPVPEPPPAPVATDPVGLLQGHATRVRALVAAGSWADAKGEAERWKDAISSLQQHPDIAPHEDAVSICRSIRTKVRSLSSDRGPLGKKNTTDTTKRLATLDAKIVELKALLDKHDDPRD